MPVKLDSRAPGFGKSLDRLLAQKLETSAEIDRAVAKIVADVKKRGDAALIAYTQKFDRAKLNAKTLRLSAGEIEAAAAKTPPKVRAALEFAESRIRAHHEKQRPADHVYTDEAGVRLGSLWHAVESAGIYVPGGLASYPSSVLMNAVPAKVAGVSRIAMVVPSPKGALNPAVLAAAKIAGVSEIYRVGGAQAVAALAYGTKTIAPVDKIVGPGNAYVAAAKRQVFGQVGIDMIAGPSEVLIIADSSANPAWVAADLLAQTEHGAGARGVLVTWDRKLAEAAAKEVERQLKTLPRVKLTREGWRKYGAIITVTTLDEAVEIANEYAAEHVELMLDSAEAILPRIRNAGAVFLGHHTPEAIGDTIANLMIRDLLVTLGFTKPEILTGDVWVGFFALLAGIFVGGILYARLGMKRSVLVSLVLMGISNLSFAGLAAAGHSMPMLAFTIGFENFASGIGGVTVVAYLSALCDLRFTATQFALLSAGAAILGRFITGTTAGALIEGLGYVNFYLFTTVLALPGILLYWWMMHTGLVDASIGNAGKEEPAG